MHKYTFLNYVATKLAFLELEVVPGISSGSLQELHSARSTVLVQLNGVAAVAHAYEKTVGKRNESMDSDSAYIADRLAGVKKFLLRSHNCDNPFEVKNALLLTAEEINSTLRITEVLKESIEKGTTVHVRDLVRKNREAMAV